MLLRVDDLSLKLPSHDGGWKFAKQSEKEIYSDISFSLDQGSSLGIVGESGSGKTSLAKTLVRLHSPSGGRIRFDGLDITHLDTLQLQALRPKLQFIFQDSLSSLNPRRKVGEAILQPLLHHRLASGRREGLELTRELFERVGLSRSLMERYPHELSGGQRQRVGIARAISLKPKLIIADEVVSGLDVSTQAQILILLRELQDDGSLIFISHDLSVVRVLCEHVLVMRQGRVEDYGKTVDIFSRPKSRYTRELLSAIPTPVVEPNWLDKTDLTAEYTNSVSQYGEKTTMKIEGSVALVSGANRGIGRAFVECLIKRGAKKVYVTARDPKQLDSVISIDPGKVHALQLDITDGAQIENAVGAARDVDLLINNAGANGNTSMISISDTENARREMEVNYFGTMAMCRAFASTLKANGGGAIVNVLSILSKVNLPASGSYSASKAAAYSMTQGVRAELAAQNTLVVGVMPGAVDTDMAKDFQGPKENPIDVANESLQGVEDGIEDVYPGGMAQGVNAGLGQDPKAVEKEFAGYLPA
jgi:ABC-type oligopeptide transport system ATPase subunit/NAD(P)-dependent dehydrogenase (short-subunit alcohol dehydrogenase family)